MSSLSTVRTDWVQDMRIEYVVRARVSEALPLKWSDVGDPRYHGAIEEDRTGTAEGVAREQLASGRFLSFSKRKLLSLEG